MKITDIKSNKEHMYKSWTVQSEFNRDKAECKHELYHEHKYEHEPYCYYETES